MSHPSHGSDAEVIEENGGSAGDGGTPESPNGRSGPTLRALGMATPMLVLTTLAVCALGYVQKLPCKQSGFDPAVNYSRGCYTDIYPLYFVRGLADGKVPYLDKVKDPVEYPVVTGGFMQLISSLVHWLVSPFTDGGGSAAMIARGMAFYQLTALAMALFAVVAVVATAYVAGRRGSKVGVMMAVSPGLLLAAYINWDLLAIALSALAFAAWAKRWNVLAGVLLGLAVATKFYPIIFLGPLLLLCWRAGAWRPFFRMLGGTVGAWLVVNVPIMILAFDGWARFYGFSQARPVDWGSIFYFFTMKRVPFLGTTDVSTLNLLGTGAFLILCVGIAVLALAAPRRPRLPQLLFLVLAAFLLTNKVWSPQYVLWLLPLVALARPKLPAFLVWQIAEVGYFLGIWWYLLWLQWQADPSFVSPGAFHGIDDNQYFVVLIGRFLAVLLLVVLVVVDILRPKLDAVRAEGEDDPAGGVLDGAEDRFSLRRRRGRTPQPAAT